MPKADKKIPTHKGPVELKWKGTRVNEWNKEKKTEW